MDVRTRGNSLLRTYQTICVLAYDIRRAIIDFHPSFSAFQSFERQLKLIHKGLFNILRTINAPINEFLHLGLRTSDQAWERAPATTREALREVSVVLFAMEPLLNLRNGRIVLDSELQFNLELAAEVANIHSLYAEDLVDVAALDETNLSHLQHRGATDEQISSLPVQVATEQDTTQECSICLVNFIAGESISALPCLHRFHRSCIGTWLRLRRTCPVDRSEVFSS